MSDNVYKKKDLNPMDQLLRRGKLKINPRKIMIDVRGRITVPNVVPDQPTEKAREKKYGAWAHYPKHFHVPFHTILFGEAPKIDPNPSPYDRMGERQDLWATIQDLRAHPERKFQLKMETQQDFCVQIYKQDLTESRNRGYYNSNRSCNVLYMKFDNGNWHIYLRKDLRKNFLQEELAVLKLNKARTVKEWLQFFRHVRKVIRRGIIDETMKGCLNRLDWVKEYTGHVDLMKDIRSKTAEIAAAVGPFKNSMDDVEELLTPFVAVEPYETMRHNIHHIQSEIESIMDNLKSLRQEPHGAISERDTDEYDSSE